jgi:hypothetical protein
MQTRYFNVDNRQFYESEDALIASLGTCHMRVIKNPAIDQTLVAASAQPVNEQVAMFRCRVASGQAKVVLDELKQHLKAGEPNECN